MATLILSCTDTDKLLSGEMAPVLDLILSAALCRMPEADAPFRNNVIKNLLGEFDAVEATRLILTHPKRLTFTQLERLTVDVLHQLVLFGRIVGCVTHRKLGLHAMSCTTYNCLAGMELGLQATIETALMYLMGTSDDIRVAGKECTFALTVCVAPLITSGHAFEFLFVNLRHLIQTVAQSVVRIHRMSHGTNNGGKVTLIGSSSIRTFFTLYEALATDRVLGTYSVTTLPHIIIYEAELEAAPHVITRIKAVGIALKSHQQSLSLCVLDDGESTAEDTAHETAHETAEDTAHDTARDAAHETAGDNAHDTATDTAGDTAADDAEDTAADNAEDDAEDTTEDTAEDTAEDDAKDTAEDDADENASDGEVITTRDFVTRIQQGCELVESILRGEVHAHDELDAPVSRAFPPREELIHEESAEETATKPVAREGGLVDESDEVMQRVAREYAKLRADHTELLANHARLASETAALQGLIMHKMSGFQDDTSEDAEARKAAKKPRK